MRRIVSMVGSCLAGLVLAWPLAALSLGPLRGNGASLHWSGPQFVQADARGNVFLLRGDTLDVYPVVQKTHELGKPVRLAPSGATSGPLLDAALSADGDDWVLALPSGIERFSGGEERPVPPLPWFPTAVGFVRGDLAALVVPPLMFSPEKGDDDPPVLLIAGHDAWSAEIREALHGPAYDANDEMLYRAARVLDDREGRYYLARQYAYRIELRRLGRSRPLGELRIGKGAPLRSKSAEEDAKKLLAEAKAEGSDLSHAKVSAFHGRDAVLALAHGPGGLLYVLAGSGIGGARCALDRVDWEGERVERIPLDLPCNGRTSLAVGRDGLYLAKYDGRAGRYFAPWAAVEAAHWAKVKDAVFTP